MRVRASSRSSFGVVAGLPLGAAKFQVLGQKKKRLVAASFLQCIVGFAGPECTLIWPLHLRKFL